ncbi:adenine phosphoribosyltransferase [Pseudoxanthomonas dokdonensis]|uniref:Adenine phosphoribosyltransferase n=1 Tax=Pseudoxanthomonas dokdonensis TaxID=344882 RepID=A0A0R0CUH1_9GAMM|nr:adenine phosphoribosyltransferase [Pseudoxanthomonas dokdonensis]KRG69978.1 adenine phosphoribosyltransferase [Pseudoxanthomonas dokdonensis]
MLDATAPVQADWPALLRDVADFPRPGILFKDITPLLADAHGFAAAIATLAAPWRAAPPHAVVGIESRGFILGAALAQALGVGFVPVRKPGKLPGPTLALDYALEYGSDRLEMHVDALPAGAPVLLVDDVLATGGTLQAAVALLQQQGAHVVAASVLIELSALSARQRWDAQVPLLAGLVI